MNKTDLVAAVAARTGNTKKDSAAFVDAFFETITEALADGEAVQLQGFGVFEVKQRAARTARNPLTKEEVEVPAANRPVFRASKLLKEAVDKE